MTSDEVIGLLGQYGCALDRIKPIQYGTQLIFRNGSKVSVYDSGKVNVQGKHFNEVRRILGLSAPRIPAPAAQKSENEF